VKRKQVCLALRYICHAHGCDLVFGSIKEKLPAQLFKSMLTLRSSPASEAQPSKVERDHN
jgi:dynein light intermediate chain 2